MPNKALPAVLIPGGPLGEVSLILVVVHSNIERRT